MCCEISSPVIPQMWENKSGVGADPRSFLTWWSFNYTLLSATFPLNMRIIWSDPFSGGSYYYVAFVCNHCHRKNQNICSMMGLTSHLSCVYETFFLIAFLFIWWWFWRWCFYVRVIWYVLFFIFLWNFVGCVSGIFSVGRVNGIFSVNRVAKSVGRFSGIFSIGRVSGLFSVSRVRELFSVSQIPELIRGPELFSVSRIPELIWVPELSSRSKTFIVSNSWFLI